MGFGHRNCAVFGCHNSGKRLDKGSRERCEVHNLLIRGKRPCVCEPPFKLFAFPTIKKNSEARKRWIKLKKHQDLREKPLEPKPSSRVWSAHFGKPTDENPDPVLKLGYQSPVCSSRKRKLPTERMPLVPSKRSRKSETHWTVTDTDFANPSTSRVGGHELPNTPNNHKNSVYDTCFDSESIGDFGPNTNGRVSSCYFFLLFPIFWPASYFLLFFHEYLVFPILGRGGGVY